MTLKAHSDSRLMVNGNLATVAQLRDMVGSEATVVYLAESRTVLALNTRDKKGLNAVNVKVLIMAVNPAAGTVVLQTPSGQEITLNVTAQSSIVADGAISSLADLRGMVGSEAEVEYLPESKEVLALQGHSIPLHARAVNGEQVRDGDTGIVTRPRAGEIQAQAVMTGTLKAVNVTEGTVTVITQSGQEVVLKIAPGTTVLVGSSPATVADLAASVGSHVTVTSYEGATTAVEISIGGDAPISRRATARGTVKFFNERADATGQGRLTLIRAARVGQVSEMVLQVTADTLVLINGTRAGISDLLSTTGAPVTVEYNRHTNIAIVIAVEAAASATGSATEPPPLPRSP